MSESICFSSAILIGSHCLGGPSFMKYIVSLQPYKRKGLNWPFCIFLGSFLIVMPIAEM